jgi:hypothetical protein
MEKCDFVLREDAPPDIVREYEEYEEYMKRALVEGFERMRWCPYFKEEISEGLCWDVLHCGRGEFKKSSTPEVTDWDKAIRLCSKCPHQFD